MPARNHASEGVGRPERPPNVAVVEACTLLNGVGEEHRARLVSETFLAYAERGEVIWFAGADCRFAAVVGMGFVKMTRTTPQGTAVTVELMGPGQSFGAIAALEGRVYHLSATAVTNCWYLKIPSELLRQVYEGSAILRDQVLRSMSPRLRRAHDMMARMSSAKVDQRIAAVLLLLMDSYGVEEVGGTALCVPLTRQDLAEMAGTTVETTIRVMGRWTKMKLLSAERQRVTILDPAGLLSSGGRETPARRPVRRLPREDARAT
ncbi:MAG: Crp/Fnr family transcriptional regulator [Fimbriimonadaceae bacterium]|nr:Crp/Fnr family transcriptional regulator [Fimbriimonadaceae bacterium]